MSYCQYCAVTKFLAYGLLYHTVSSATKHYDKDDNDNDNNNVLFDHNIEIEIIIYNNLENQITDWSGDYY